MIMLELAGRFPPDLDAAWQERIAALKNGLGCWVEELNHPTARQDPAMPTVPPCPSARQERDRLQARRLRAAELFALGVRQAEVARQLGVSPKP
jgi:hypothetical protein